jgi:hypothetical protein
MLQLAQHDDRALGAGAAWRSIPPLRTALNAATLDIKSKAGLESAWSPSRLFTCRDNLMR